MNQISDVDAAWATGLIDGEGHVDYERTTRKGYCYCPVVQVTMTQPSAVYKLAALTGSKVRVRGPYGRGRKVLYVWRLGGDQAVAFLERIRPYLTVKAVEAWLTLEARAQCPPLRPGWESGIHRGLTEEQVVLRQGYNAALLQARKG